MVRYGDACVDGEREEVVSCFVCSAGYDADAALLRSVYGSSSGSSAAASRTNSGSLNRRRHEARPSDRRGTSELWNN